MRRVDADVGGLMGRGAGFGPPPDGAGGPPILAESCPAEDLGTARRRWVAIWSRLPERMSEVTCDPERMACLRVERPGHGDVVVGTVLPWRADLRHHPRTGSEEFAHALRAQA